MHDLEDTTFLDLAIDGVTVVTHFGLSTLVLNFLADLCLSDVVNVRFSKVQ